MTVIFRVDDRTNFGFQVYRNLVYEINEDKEMRLAVSTE